MTTPRTQKEYYDIGKNEAQSRVPELTDFNEGSINDIIIGIPSVMAQEITRLLLDKFKKTMFASATENDLETLATDRFGNNFARPEAQKALGVVKFERPNADAGDCVIGLGTVVKTPLDANGNSQRFETLSAVTMTGLEISASVQAIDAGLSGNVDADEVTVIETVLTDPTITVNNDDAFSGGAEEETDAEYRETITRLIEALKGATLASIESAALNVAGIEYATAREFKTIVKEWDEANGITIGDAFNISNVKLYVADINGVASDALIDLVETAIEEVRAAGVVIAVLSAVAQSVNWTASITLDPGGPNYATLQSDTTMIENTMREYIEGLAIGDDFVRATANAAMLAIWGPAGTGDITAFTTSVPSGDIEMDSNEKAIPGSITIG